MFGWREIEGRFTDLSRLYTGEQVGWAAHNNFNIVMRWTYLSQIYQS